MTVVYCDWATGNDSTGDGSHSNPYKTIDKASTGLTGGDEVRVAKSAAPTALTGTISITHGSTSVTGSGTAFLSQLVAGDFIEAGGYWWEVVTVTNNTSATLYRSYGGTTVSGVASRKLGVTSTGASAASTTVIQTVSASGTAGNNLVVSGGWDLATQTRDGETWFRQMHGTFNNRWGIGLTIANKSYVEVKYLNFLRYNDGLRALTDVFFCVFSDITACSCATRGMSIAICKACQFTRIAAISNANTGIRTSSANCIFRDIVCMGNQSGFEHAADATANGYNNVIFDIYAQRNLSADIRVASGNLRCYRATLLTTTKVVMGGANANDCLTIDSLNGGGAQTWTDGGNIIQQAASAGGTGMEWAFNVTSSTRSSLYPLKMVVAAVAVDSGALVTVNLYFKKSGTGIAARLLCRGGQIAGVSSDVSSTCPDDTSRNQVTITFTPSAAGVVEIEVEAWYVSSTSQSVIIDDIEITQA